MQVLPYVVYRLFRILVLYNKHCTLSNIGCQVFTLPVADFEGTPTSGNLRQKALDSFESTQEYSLVSTRAENCNVAADAPPSPPPIGQPLHVRPHCASNPPPYSSFKPDSNRCCRDDLEEKAQEERPPRLEKMSAGAFGFAFAPTRHVTKPLLTPSKLLQTFIAVIFVSGE